jgi:arsenate reductase
MTPQRMYRVAFLCVKNSCRSQMAEVFAQGLAPDVIVPFSGGTEPGDRVDHGAVEVMKELGYDMAGAKPKSLPREVLSSLDLVVHMGCGGPGGCMVVPGIPSEDWGIEDPVGGPREMYLAVARTIEAKVRDLAVRLRERPPSASEAEVAPPSFTLGDL